MCLLVVESRVDPGVPLVVAANRDERVDRPATAAAVLQGSGPRVVGGRDDEAGGTWLAVNERGVVAGLTNLPAPEGRDPSKRSRGELPLALARATDADGAVDDFARRFRPRDYNPSWLLVGDRRSLYYVDMTGHGEDRPAVQALAPGIHILENNPLGTRSAKERHVRRLLGSLPGLAGVLADHSLPAERVALPDGVEPAVLAACVHTDRYGTRSSAIIRVLGDGAPPTPPTVLVADGHPCTSPFVDVSGLWRD